MFQIHSEQAKSLPVPAPPPLAHVASHIQANRSRQVHPESGRIPTGFHRLAQGGAADAGLRWVPVSTIINPERVEASRS